MHCFLRGIFFRMGLHTIWSLTMRQSEIDELIKDFVLLDQKQKTSFKKMMKRQANKKRGQPLLKLVNEDVFSFHQNQSVLNIVETTLLRAQE